MSEGWIETVAILEMGAKDLMEEGNGDGLSKKKKVVDQIYREVVSVELPRGFCSLVWGMVRGGSWRCFGGEVGKTLEY